MSAERRTISTVARAWIEEETGARVEEDEVLEGSTSATLFSLRLVSAGWERAAVLRLFTNVGWLTEEADLAKHEAAILRWLAEEISPDTYVNLMGQYRPAYEVGQIARDGSVRYAEIARRPHPEEIEAAHQAARRAGLWRFDERA